MPVLPLPFIQLLKASVLSLKFLISSAKHIFKESVEREWVREKRIWIWMSKQTARYLYKMQTSSFTINMQHPNLHSHTFKRHHCLAVLLGTDRALVPRQGNNGIRTLQTAMGGISYRRPNTNSPRFFLNTIIKTWATWLVTQIWKSGNSLD